MAETTDMTRHESLGDEALAQLFSEAHTAHVWADRPLPPGTPRRLYEAVKWGPTSANVTPARFVFVTTPEGKARLSPHLSRGNHDKTMAAPMCVIIGYDMAFAEKLPFLNPPQPSARYWFDDPKVKFETALRNSSLQGAYLILAARAMGFDCGPMSGFDNDGVDREFFAGTEIRSNFICTVGYAADGGYRPRNPRLPFDEACQIA
jgi:nitroreductase